MLEVLLATETTGQHCNISVHNPVNGQSLSTFKCGTSKPNTLCLQRDERILSAFPNKSMLQVYEISRKSQQPVKVPVPGVVTSLCASHDGALLAAGIKNEALVWELSSGDLLCVLSRHYQQITCLEFSHDDSYLVSSGKDGIVTVWDTTDIWDDKNEQIEPFCSWSCHTMEVTKVLFGLRYRLYSSSMDRSVKVHDVPSQQTIMTIVCDFGVTAFALSPNEAGIFAGYSNGDLMHFNFLQCGHDTNVYHATEEMKDSGKKLIKNAHTKKINCIACSIDGTFLVTGADDAEVKFWNCFSLQCIKSLSLSGPVSNLLFAPAYNGFTGNSKVPIPPLPRLNRQIRISSDNAIEDTKKSFKIFKSSC